MDQCFNAEMCSCKWCWRHGSICKCPPAVCVYTCVLVYVYSSKCVSNAVHTNQCLNTQLCALTHTHALTLIYSHRAAVSFDQKKFTVNSKETLRFWLILILAVLCNIHVWKDMLMKGPPVLKQLVVLQLRDDFEGAWVLYGAKTDV